MNWNKYPFFRLVFPLSLGILLAQSVDVCCVSLKKLFVLLMALSLLGVGCHRWIVTYRYRWVFGLNLIFVFVLVGCLRSWTMDPTTHDTFYNSIVRDSTCGFFIARVCESPSEKRNSVKVQLDLRLFHSDTAIYKVSGKVLAYLEKTSGAMGLSYGDVLAFGGPIEEIPPPKNPEEFDYRGHLRRLGVTGSVFLKEGNWLSLGVNEGNPMIVLANRFRSHLLCALRRSGITEDEFGVAAAILLGYDESLSPQLRQQYVAAGSMHILCVSGMHVGLLYLMASFVLGFIGHGKRAARIREWILLTLLWCYAILAGLSPSILRSTLMITMLIVGKLLNRKGVTLNSIAASAFLILLLNPNDLFSVGFQLSYAAVVGIVVLQRPIYLLFYISNKFLDKVWEITAVALSAQLATLPFAVYYFHQFTPYFWLSNLVMTPLSFLTILTGMLLLFVAWIPGVSLLVGKLVWACLRVMNLSVAWVESLPCSLVKGLYMNPTEFGLSLLLLLLFLLFVSLKKKRLLLEGLVVACVFSGSLAFKSQRAAEQQRFVAYSLKKHTAIDFIQGSAHVLLCDDELLCDAQAIDYSLKGAWAKQQLVMNPPCYTLLEDMDLPFVVKRRHLLAFGSTLFAFWDPSSAENYDSPMKVDVLMVREKQSPDMNLLCKRYQPKMILVDGTVPSYLSERWKTQAESMNIACHCLGEGCFVSECPKK